MSIRYANLMVIAIGPPPSGPGFLTTRSPDTSDCPAEHAPPVPATIDTTARLPEPFPRAP
eukprot:10258133-Heterocapsa_arctica.AAC.1